MWEGLSQLYTQRLGWIPGDHPLSCAAVQVQGVLPVNKETKDLEKPSFSPDLHFVLLRGEGHSHWTGSEPLRERVNRGDDNNMEDHWHAGRRSVMRWWSAMFREYSSSLLRSWGENRVSIFSRLSSPAGQLWMRGREKSYNMWPAPRKGSLPRKNSHAA